MELVPYAIGMLLVVALVGAIVGSRGGNRHGRRPSGPGPAAAGAFYELLDHEKRNAIEIVVEERAGARDPETADGNLPELEDPRE